MAEKYMGSSIIGLIKQKLAAKQDKLVSGSNIKTINGNSLVGGGDLAIASGGYRFIDEKRTSFYSINTSIFYSDMDVSSSKTMARRMLLIDLDIDNPSISQDVDVAVVLPNLDDSGPRLAFHLMRLTPNKSLSGGLGTAITVRRFPTLTLPLSPEISAVSIGLVAMGGSSIMLGGRANIHLTLLGY